MHTRSALVAIALASVASSAMAVTASFNFESVSSTAATYGPFSGGYTSLPMSDSGVTATVTRSTGLAFDVMDMTGQSSPFLFPAGWGANCLSPFNASAASDRFVATFTGDAVYSFGIEFGDFGADAGYANFDVYDTSNTLIYSDSVYWDGGLNLGNLGTWGYTSSVQIGSVTFWGEDGTSGFPMSLYWDNMTAATAAVPLPSAAGLGVAGLALTAGLRRRR